MWNRALAATAFWASWMLDQSSSSSASSNFFCSSLFFLPFTTAMVSTTTAYLNVPEGSDGSLSYFGFGSWFLWQCCCSKTFGILSCSCFFGWSFWGLAFTLFLLSLGSHSSEISLSSEASL